MEKWEKQLETIYTTPANPASFSGPVKLQDELRKKGFHIGIHRINRWLQKQDSYALFKQTNRKFKTNRVLVSKMDELWETDLISLQSLAKDNDGYNFILLTIDVLSKYIFLRPLKNKSGKIVAEAFETIFVNDKIPTNIRSDAGGEYTGARVREVFKKYKINFYTALNFGKAVVAERAIKTIRNKIFRYLEHNKSDRYIDQLQLFADSYNSTIHSSIGVAPNDVNIKNESMINWILFWPRHPKLKKMQKNKTKNKKKGSKFRFQVGWTVRIAGVKKVFSKESTSANWTREIFKIKSRKLRNDIPIYTLTGLDSEEAIRGSFYQSELQRAEVDPNKLWNIQKILKTRKISRTKKQALVRWEHYGPAYDSWVNIDDMKTV